MRIVADENFPADAVEALREQGHSVLWVRTDCPGESDRNILELAQEEGALLVTFDKDFGDLALQ